MNREREYIKPSPVYKIPKDVLDEYHKIRDDILDNNIIPDRYPESIIDDFVGSFRLREDYCKYISWCLVSNSWIDPLYNIIKGSNCIELYAGRGILSKLLQDRGLKIEAYDDFSWNYRNYQFTDVINKDALAVVKEYKSNLDYILMSWVPYQDSTINKVAKAIKKYHPETTIIWIGEDYGGCNGTDKFFEMTREVNELWEVNDNFQQWDGLHDRVVMLKMK